MAPEIIKEETYDQKVDTWSVGVITFILLSGRPPFKGKSKQDMFKAITQEELQFDDKNWKHISSEAKDFIKKALIKDAKHRSDAKHLLSHSWLYKMIKAPLITDIAALDVANNLKQFIVRVYLMTNFRILLFFNLAF